VLERPYPPLLGSQSSGVDAPPSFLKFDAQLFLQFGCASKFRLLTVSGYAAFPQKCLQCCVTHSSPCRNTCRTVGVDPARIFFSNGGRTTVEVLNPASAFGVSSPPLPPHLVLGRNVHSFGFCFYGWGGPGFPILNVGGMGGTVSQK
jgi:hypothetical protein